MFTDTKSALLYVLFCAVIPYLLGSLSFSIIVSRLLFRKDVRNYGSHNAGMTNVLRTFGKGAAALTLAGDIGKGVAAVLLAKWFFSAHLNDAIYYRGAIIGVYLAAFFAVIGHVYPLYFGFKGGKAVAGNGHHRRAGARAACAAGRHFLCDAGVRQNGVAGKRAVRRGLPAGDALLPAVFRACARCSGGRRQRGCGCGGPACHLAAPRQHCAHPRGYGIQIFSEKKVMPAPPSALVWWGAGRALHPEKAPGAAESTHFRAAQPRQRYFFKKRLANCGRICYYILATYEEEVQYNGKMCLLRQGRGVRH